MSTARKVSVIVPIYKVEKYIHRCLNSIVHQTYSALEIILVNDGSPDDCGKIADFYAEKDERIKVIHKENGGLSDARNKGIEASTGEFTMFVDSDDWLAVTMIETMMTEMHKYNADVVQSAFYYAYDQKLLVDQRYMNGEKSPSALTNRELMQALVKNKKIKNFAWGKLFKSKYIADIPFKKGVLFEDVYWAHQVMHRVKTYLILPQPFYYYYQRDNSIVSTYTIKNLDMLAGLKERHQFITRHYPELTEESWKNILETSLIHYNLLLRKKEIDQEGRHREEIRSYIRENKRNLKSSVIGNRDLRVQLALFSIHPVVYRLYLFIRKGLRTVHILPKSKGLERAVQSPAKGAVAS